MMVTYFYNKWLVIIIPIAILIYIIAQSFDLKYSMTKLTFIQPVDRISKQTENKEEEIYVVNVSKCMAKEKQMEHSIHLLNETEANLKLSFKYPTFLTSHGGSGNTLTRLLIEEITNIYTGSLYMDKKLQHRGFEGEGLCNKQYQVIAVKMHPEHHTDLFLDKASIFSCAHYV